MNTLKRRFVLAGFISLALVATACGDDSDSSTATDAPAATSVAPSGTAAGDTPATEAPADLSGDIAIDGSSTVAPLMKLTAESFQDANGGVTVAVGTSGTGGGFEKFCAGETDISNASRPIKDTEIEECTANGVEFYEVLVANDALSVVVNLDNDWATCLTVEQLKTMWEPAAQGKVRAWKDVNPAWPNQPVKLFGAGSDSGTFDYFTEAIVGKAKSSRGDYTASEDDNVLVKGIQGDANAIGYFGFAYYAANPGSLKALAVDWGKGQGCVKPSLENVLAGTYNPLSRPLFIYVSQKAAAKPEVKAMVDFVMTKSVPLIKEVKYLPLPDNAYKVGMERFTKGELGSSFGGVPEVGLHIDDILRKKAVM